MIIILYIFFAILIMYNISTSFIKIKKINGYLMFNVAFLLYYVIIPIIILINYYFNLNLLSSKILTNINFSIDIQLKTFMYVFYSTWFFIFRTIIL